MLSPSHVLDSLDFSSNLCLPLNVAQLIGNFTDNYNYYYYLEIIIDIHTHIPWSSLSLCVWVFFSAALLGSVGCVVGSEGALSTEHY